MVVNNPIKSILININLLFFNKDGSITPRGNKRKILIIIDKLSKKANDNELLNQYLVINNEKNILLSNMETFNNTPENRIIINEIKYRIW